jgi:hypothetical protein
MSSEKKFVASRMTRKTTPDHVEPQEMKSSFPDLAGSPAAKRLTYQTSP